VNTHSRFYAVVDALNKTEYYVYPGDIELGDDKWMHNGVQITLNQDGTAWSITTNELDVSSHDKWGDTILFDRGTPDDLERLYVQMRLTHG